jgi:hypothetical protein
MRTRMLFVIAMLAGLVGREEVRAQDQGPCPGMYPSPQVGEYAELQFTGDTLSMPVRFTVVGEGDVEGRKHYWVEFLSVITHGVDTVIVQMLVPSYPFETIDLKGYIVQMPGQPPIRIPDEMIPQLAQSTTGPSWRDECDSAVDLGNERVTVGSGAFIARHYRSPDETKEVWIADVPFGMVKMLTMDGRMELIDFGTDGQPFMRGEPIEYVPPGG